MNDNDQLNKTTSSTSGKSNLSGKRRVLLKGSAAMIPAVFTLKSGAAFALGSTGTCVSRDKVQAATEINAGTLKILQDTKDNWVRKAVPCRTLTDVSDPLNAFKIYVEEIANQNQTLDWRDGTDRDAWYQETGTDIPPKWQKKGQPSPLYTVTPTIDLPADTCYILAQVDANCNIIGYGLEGLLGAITPTPYVTGSCWTSIIGTTAAT